MEAHVSDETPTAPNEPVPPEPATEPQSAVLVDDAPVTDPAGPPPWPAGAPGARTAPPAPPRPPHETTGRPDRWKQFLVGALVGALVGGATAAGVTAAVESDGGGSDTVVVRSGQETPGRNTSTIAQPRDIQGILAKVEPAVVAIRAGSNFGSGAGTGFVISADGLVVTNNHVVDGAEEIEVTFHDGTTETADVVGSSADNDLAVLKVDATGLATAELGSSDALQVGDEVVAIGNALALEGGLSVTRGIISAKDRTVPEPGGATIYNALQTDTAINPGNSGGPLVNAAGEVVGINTAIAPPETAQNVGFAISIDAAKSIIDDLRLGREVRTAFLGVATVQVTEDLAEEESLEVDTGLYVGEVTAGSAADDAGVEEGDVILAVDGTAVDTPAEFGAAIRRMDPGDTVELRIDRDGDARTLTATLGTRPANDDG
jgi:putative serine protease PepD